MSTLGDALQAVKQALLLADDVKRLGQQLSEHSRELRDHDRRLARLEAQWDTAMTFAGARAKPPPLGHDD